MSSLSLLNSFFWLVGPKLVIFVHLYNLALIPSTIDVVLFERSGMSILGLQLD